MFILLGKLQTLDVLLRMLKPDKHRYISLTDNIKIPLGVHTACFEEKGIIGIGSNFIKNLL